MVSQSNSASKLGILWAISILSVWFTYTYAVQFSSFAFGLAAITMIYSVIRYIDKYMIPQFDTFEEIKKSPIAIAIYFVGLSLTCAIAMLASR